MGNSAEYDKVTTHLHRRITKPVPAEILFSLIFKFCYEKNVCHYL